MAVELRLGDEDRAKYGGPEWIEFDQDLLDDLDADVLDRLEREMDMSVFQLRYVEMRARTGRALRASVWLARQLSGDPELKKPTYAEFKIKPLHVRARPVGGDDDAGPPDDSSASGSTPAADTQDSSNASTASPETARPPVSEAAAANPEPERSPQDSPS